MPSIDPRARPWLLAGSIVLAVLAAYANCYDVPFQFDDDRNIVAHAAIRTLVLRPEDGPNLHYRRPVGRWTLWLNYSIHRFDVRGYHALNVAVHIGAALALFGLVRRTLKLPKLAPQFGNAADKLALAVALLWALHPLQVQSVTYIIQRFESLMGLFFLLSLYCLVRSDEVPSDGEKTNQRWIVPRLWQLAAIAAAALSLGSKEVGAMIPLVAIAFDRVFLATSWNATLRRRGWMYLGFIPALVWFATWMTPESGQFDNTSKGVTAWEYLRTQPGVILHYLRLTIWPDPLVLDYGWPIANSWTAICVPGLVIVALLAASFLALWKRPMLGFLGISFFLVLAPTSSVVPIMDLAFEHRMYLALAPLAVLAMIGMHALLAQLDHRDAAPGLVRWLSVVLVLCVAVVLAARTFARNSDWRDTLVLWEKNTHAAPTSYRAWGNLANCYLKQGRIEPALAAARQAANLKPQSQQVREIYGAVLLAAGKPREALAEYQRAAAEAPDYGNSHFGMGRSCQALDRIDEAEQHYRRAIVVDGHLADAHHALARLLSERGKDAEAIAHYEAACRQNTDDPQFPTNFGGFYARRNNFEQALAQFQEAIRRRPDYAQAHLQLALVQFERGDLPAASQAAVKLLRLRPDSVAARQLLEQIDERSRG